MGLLLLGGGPVSIGEIPVPVADTLTDALLASGISELGPSDSTTDALAPLIIVFPPVVLVPINFPVRLPSPGIARTTFHQHTVVARSRSPFSLVSQIQIHAGQLWAVDVFLAPMERDLAEEWVGALVSLNGGHGFLLLGDVANKSPRGSAPGSPVVDGSNQAGHILSTKGWTPNSQNILRRGDWIQLGSPDTSPPGIARLYKVIDFANINSDPDGKADIKIWPRLRESPKNNEALVLTDTKGTFELAENNFSWDIDEARHYGIEFRVIESLRFP